jgi:succinoglycan biosynthesis protein ExoM
MRKIAIGVTTFERPVLLRRALEAIAALQCDAEIHVFVADNSFKKQAGVQVAEEMRDQGFPFPLTAFAVAERGITYSRNALLREAFEVSSFDGLAFVDDDQRPDVTWLQLMMEMQAITDADIVAPVVLPEFERPPSLWAQKSRVYFRDASANGLVKELSGNGGILIVRRVAELLEKPWYNHLYAISGGEDADLFLRLQQNGARFARAKTSIIHEFYPASRQNLAWALQRAYRIGNTAILIELQNKSKSRVVLAQLHKIASALLCGPALAVLCLWSPGLAVDMLCKASRACGKLTGLLGSRYLEYERIHGN